MRIEMKQSRLTALAGGLLALGVWVGLSGGVTLAMAQAPPPAKETAQKALPVSVPQPAQAEAVPPAHAPAPSPVTLTEVEQLQVDSKMKDYQILQLEMQQKNVELSVIQAEFQKLVMAIKQAHKWGDDVQVQPEGKQMKFFRLPKAATVPESVRK